jgi:hypothetical protein
VSGECSVSQFGIISPAGRQNERVTADGTFAKLLLRGLRGDADVYHEGIISADDLGIYLKHEVPRLTQGLQTPQFNSIANAALSEGQFYFLTGRAHSESVLRPAPAPAPQPAPDESQRLRGDAIKRFFEDK